MTRYPPIDLEIRVPGEVTATLPAGATLDECRPAIQGYRDYLQAGYPGTHLHVHAHDGTRLTTYATSTEEERTVPTNTEPATPNTEVPEPAERTEAPEDGAGDDVEQR